MKKTWYINPKTNVTNKDIITAAKIVLAHPNEYANYYNVKYRLHSFENFLKQKKNEK